MSALPRPLVCPILQKTHGLSRATRAQIQKLQKSARACAKCPGTGECHILDWLLVSLREALGEVLVELEGFEDLVEDLVDDLLEDQDG